MKKRFRFHRPSPAMGVSLVALFVALSGGAYAATAIPNNSVGNAQLKSDSVGNAQLRASSVGTDQLRNRSIINTKLALGAVGYARINQAQVQRRVTGTCKTGEAIVGVAQNGTVACAATGAGEYNSTAPGTSVSVTPTAVGTSPTAATVASYQLPAGSAYLVQADPQLTATPGSKASAANVTASCTLSVNAGGLATSTTGSSTFDTTADDTTKATTGSAIPLTLAVASQSSAVNVTLSCSANYAGTIAPSMSASGTIYALGTSSATTVTTPAS